MVSIMCKTQVLGVLEVDLLIGAQARLEDLAQAGRATQVLTEALIKTLEVEAVVLEDLLIMKTIAITEELENIMGILLEDL